jgi:hypothetical protein
MKKLMIAVILAGVLSGCSGATDSPEYQSCMRKHWMWVDSGNKNRAIVCLDPSDEDTPKILKEMEIGND